MSNMDSERFSEETERLNQYEAPKSPDFNTQGDDEKCVEINEIQITKEEKPTAEIVASLVMASFHLVIGFSLAYSAILTPQLEHESSEIPATPRETAWIASSLVLMTPIGALLAGVLMEYVGRVNALQIAVIPCVLGWCLTALSSNIAMLLVGRLLLGICSGMGTSPAIVYITEVAQPKFRGMLMSTGPGIASLGMLMAYVEGAFLGWRIVAWTALPLVLVPLALTRLCVPESPVWLVARGRIDEARESLCRLVGNNNCRQEETLAAMVKSQDMKALVLTSFTERLYKAIFLPTGYKPLLILTGLFFFQQFTGIYITLFYAVTLFEDAGSGIDPSLASILVGCMRVIMSCCNTALMKNFGRRPLFIVSCVGMAVCMTVSGIFTKLVHEGEKEYSWVPVTFILLFVCVSMVGMLSIPWTMTAELFPTEIRGFAHGVVTSIAHVFMFLSVQLYRPLTVLFGGAHVVQWGFACMSIGALVFICLFLPETHNKSLTEIEQYFRENNIYLKLKCGKKRSSIRRTAEYGTSLQPINAISEKISM